jgi:hypothetical protein
MDKYQDNEYFINCFWKGIEYSASLCEKPSFDNDENTGYHEDETLTTIAFIKSTHKIIP